MGAEGEQLQQQFSCAHDTPQYASVLSSLGDLKLEAGKVAEAEKLFREALEAREKSELAPSPAGAEEDDEDGWEKSWDSGALEIPTARPAERPPAAPRAAVAAPRAPRERPSDGAGTPAPPDEDIPFGGGHVLELYNLTAADTTTHLERLRAVLHPGAALLPTLKWVDDSHAVLVYTDPHGARAALQALSALPQQQRQYGMRAYVDASPAARRLPASELQPPKPRPATSAATARRLIGGALNIRGLADRQEEARLAAARRQERGSRAAREKELAAAWED